MGSVSYKDQYQQLEEELVFSKHKERMVLFRKIPTNEQGFVLLVLPFKIQKKVLKQLNNEEIVELIKYLDFNEAVKLLRSLKKERRKEIIEELNEDIKEKVNFLLSFDPETAASLINLNYIEVDKNSSFAEVREEVKEYERKTRKFPEILVVDNGFLVGELEGSTLFFHNQDEKIENYVRSVPSVKYNEHKKTLISLFRRNPTDQVVVLDDNDSILGVIYSSDILQLIGDQSSKSLSEFAGVSEEEDVYDSVLTKVKNRYQWLIINLGTAFLASWVVSLFQKTISKWVLLAVYMPIVAGMGGNAATQTLAVVVRGLTLKEINFKRAKRVIINEMAAGAINGIINGVIVAIVASLFNKSPLLGLVVGLAMIINLIIAGLFGVIVPLVMKRLGKDPASSATIFITTATDVCGFFSFLGLATLILPFR